MLFRPNIGGREKGRHDNGAGTGESKKERSPCQQFKNDTAKEAIESSVGKSLKAKAISLGMRRRGGTVKTASASQEEGTTFRKTTSIP